MKTIYRPLLLTSIVALIFMSSCKDDKEVTKTKTDLLTQNTWKFNSVTASGVDAQTLALINAFLTGSEETYKKDKTYSFTSPLDSYPTTGTWEFADNEGSIILDKGNSK